MNKHKHYQAIRAYADGWEVERWNHKNKYWEASLSPIFGNLVEQFRIVPDADGWLPWYGGECPVSKGTTIEARFRDNDTGKPKAPQEMKWIHVQLAGDIVAYRVIAEPPKPKVNMNRKEAEKLINEVQMIGASRGWNMLDKLLDLIDRAEKMEREACAKVCEEPLGLDEALRHRSWWECVEAIRARSES